MNANRPPILKRTTMLRDAAVVVTALVAATLQSVAGVWFSAALALLAGTSWVIVRRTRLAARRASIDADRIVQAGFVVLGVSLVWRLDFNLLSLAVFGMWTLVCAADLDRLARRFPLASPPKYQRELVRTHLQQLGVVAAVSAVAVGAAALIGLELRLATVMLLALFVVVVMLRIGRELARTREQTEDEGE